MNRPDHARQREEILTALQTGLNTTANLARLGYQYNARLHELRRLGHNIPPPIKNEKGEYEYSYLGFDSLFPVPRPPIDSRQKWIGPENGFQIK